MPSFGIHLIVLDELREKLLQSSDRNERQLGLYLLSNREMAALGAIGPDLFYYMGMDKKLIALLADLYNLINKVPGVLDTAGEAMSQAGMPNFGYFVQDVANLAQTTISTIEVGLTDTLISFHNLIAGEGLFGASEQQKEKPETDWNWGDILHDRRSGVLARMLWSTANTSNDPAWKAYAIGYKSHLMTDFVGHPYVNQVVGGPARGWNLRHTIAEKFMDQKAYVNRGWDINQSNIDRRMRDLSGTQTIRTLSQWLEVETKQMIVDSQGMPYKFPSPPTASQIESGFDSMLDLFRLVTTNLYVKPPMRPRIVIPPLPGQYGSITNALGTLLPHRGGRLTLVDILKFLLYLLTILPGILLDIVRVVTDIIAGVLLYPLEAVLYFLQTILYNLYRSVRSYLVYSGIAFPYTDEIYTPFGQQFITCRSPDDGYPHRSPTINTWEERLGALVFKASDEQFYTYPSNPSEFKTSRSSVYPKGVDPEYFIKQLQASQTFITDWKQVNNPAALKALIPWPNPMQTSAGFGNAIDLTRFYLSLTEEDKKMFDDINLDSDRGYGYSQWHCDGGIIAGNIINERFF